MLNLSSKEIMLQTNVGSHRTSITCKAIDLNLAYDLAEMETLVLGWKI